MNLSTFSNFICQSKISVVFLSLCILLSCSREWSNPLDDESSEPDQISGNLLNEDFEDTELDIHIEISKKGSFSDEPGVKQIQEFGSSLAFGFGRSTCNANCFDNYQASLKIEFGKETYISELSFKEMELYGNWGSQGNLYFDGLLYVPVELGGSPVNSGIPDTTFQMHEIQLNRRISVIEVVVTDITGSSEIFIDDLLISGL